MMSATLKAKEDKHTTKTAGYKDMKTLANNKDKCTDVGG